MEYHRARSIDEALALLKGGRPLAGGTSLAPRIRELTSIVDLQDTGLDALDEGESGVAVGACVTLQSLLALGDRGLPALAQAARLEAGWNLRNAATLGGTLMSADGRSPLVTALLALNARVTLQPGDETVSLDALLDRRDSLERSQLITQVSIPRPRWLAYEQVARSPADRPVVCTAVAEFGSNGDGAGLHVALGGYGARPVVVSIVGAQAGDEPAEAWGRLASQAFAAAEDEWASAEYRSDVAGILVRRLIREEAAP